MSDSIYLCHKCAGTLTSCDLKEAYGCNCISGYVRDWQVPTKLADVKVKQLDALQSRLDLYRSQGRVEDSTVVLWTKNRIMIWS